MYVPIHHGTLSATANSCTIDARRNTHPVSIRHILVLDGRKLLGFVIPKQALTNAFYYVLVGVSPTCLTPSGITLGATLPPTHGVRYCLSVYSPINKRTYIYSVSFSAMRYSPSFVSQTIQTPRRIAFAILSYNLKCIIKCINISGKQIHGFPYSFLYSFFLLCILFCVSWFALQKYK